MTIAIRNSFVVNIKIIGLIHIILKRDYFCSVFFFTNTNVYSSDLMETSKSVLKAASCKFPVVQMYNAYNVPQTNPFIFQLNRIFKVKHLWSPDGGNEASKTRRSNANAPESLSTMDKNAVSMTMENSQLKKLLAEVNFVPMSNSMLRSWPKMKPGALFSAGKLKLGFLR